MSPAKSPVSGSRWDTAQNSCALSNVMTTSAGWPKGAMTSIAGLSGWKGIEIRFQPGAKAIGTAGSVICSTPAVASSPSLHEAPSAEASNAASAAASTMERAVLPFI